MDQVNDDNVREHASKEMKESKGINESNITENTSKSSKRRKRKQNNLKSREEQTQSNTNKKEFSSGSKYSKSAGKPPTMPKKNEINAEMRMSDKRLEAYGISSNTFKRKKMKEKYKPGSQ